MSSSNADSVSPPGRGQAFVRQRKAHRKSRLGCANCKLRRVKCDEAKPSCRPCLASGFICNYSRSAPDLQFSQAGVFKVDLGMPVEKTPNPSLHKSIPLALPVAGKLGSYELREPDLKNLEHFLNSTASTLGEGRGVFETWYSQGVLGLSNSYPFLLHIFLVLSQLHEMHEKSAVAHAPRRSLAFHWYHGTALFHQMLSRASTAPVLSSSERDALWMSAAMLGAAAFAYLGSLDPSDAWPLKERSSTDLDWLRMSHGKRVVWELADPSRPESLFRRMTAYQSRDPPPSASSPIRPHALPSLFYSVFDIGPPSTPDGNPYHAAAALISQLLPVEPTPHNIHHFLSFLSQIDARYQVLVQDKDPRAMILLLYWMAKVVLYPMWWTRRRTLYEGLAICIYIERHHGHNPKFMQLISYPRAVLSAVYSGVEVQKKENFVLGFTPLKM
ncbi:hypothetical protein J3458_000964 [Metarhizium acridum]|uniref:Zn(2)-C6 fungal-type domain-containing protein n=1 Tax=Metarhizium acridum (strain CQMa 102) TaxID=655827 RepID=E9DVH2_METAQ|nr:uncharacterized protein MAC_01620 [Metarhizium acridum CQMa 102]EFY92349.1 hypothetical protein MAC_01620 [Metarhizium acridum CQMa 102]KAG8424137.1 hypothetical protein J3458_000964 [Metarhizium acridum]